MIEVFREVKRVLRDDGTLWLNMGDTYAGDGNGGGGSFAKDGIRTAEPGTDKNKAMRSGPRGATNGIKPKDLIGIPWMLAFALRADGWYLRSDIIWSKSNPMPESVIDRPAKTHEYLFLLSKSRQYFYDAEAIKEEVSGEAHSRGNVVNPKSLSPVRGWAYGSISHAAIDHNRASKHEGPGPKFKVKQNESFSAAVSGLVEKRNRRSVWEIASQPCPEAHFATFPEELIKPCILAGCPAGGIVFDPFMGSGTTALVARNLQCNAIGLELNAAYIEIARKRLAQEVLEFA
jgi:DNA modification methylase